MKFQSRSPLRRPRALAPHLPGLVTRCCRNAILRALRHHAAAGAPSQRRNLHTRGFTLVEVILALGLAIGLLVVALSFHSQATHLRQQLLEESDRTSTLRLVMERLTTELRHAFEQPQWGFTGDDASLRFVTTAAPALADRDAVATSSPRSDLRLVSYRLARSLDGTNEIVTGLLRDEQALLETAVTRGAPATTTAPDSTNAPARGPEPLTDVIRFVRFWYWDGAGWSATWQSPQLPRGVEINLGAEMLPPDGTLASYPGDLHRRVIFLPASRPLEGGSNLSAETEPGVSPSPP